MEHTRRLWEPTSLALHLMAMAFMLCDHLWATLFWGQEWLTCVGRVAFPIFAFMAVEGYFHTRDLKRYLGRLLVFALLSEAPFDLLQAGVPFYPVHQNVIWTLLLGVVLVHWNERAKASEALWKRILVGVLSVVLGGVLGQLLMVDYYGMGVLTVLTFYFFRQRKWWCLAGQILVLWYLNVEMLGGYCYQLLFFGRHFEFCQQALALLALIPIWLYRGRQGHHSKPIQYFCYAFYPAHMLILWVLLQIV